MLDYIKYWASYKKKVATAILLYLFKTRNIKQ